MEMIEIEVAVERILECTRQPRVEQANFNTMISRPLIEEVVSDIDSPPFDKSMMDGFAVRTGDLQGTGTELSLIGTLTAGQVPTGQLPEGRAIRIMTGAMIPPGADAVVPREFTSDPPADSDETTVVIRSSEVQPGANILRAGTCIQKGQVVLEKGTVIRGCQIGLLAELGKFSLKTHEYPTAAILASGNELVQVDQVPGPGKIRNSNGPMLTAVLRTASCKAVNMGVVPDDAEAIERLVRQGLQADILVATGGVSVGELDLIPKIFKQLNVEEVFHGVNLKPGKPVWFGKASNGTLVYGLPGNPVSSFVCAQLFILPAIAKMLGAEPLGLKFRPGQLAAAHQVRGDRRTFWPGFIEANSDQTSDDVPSVELLPWKGSSDLLTWQRANCMVDLPAPGEYAVGDAVRFLELV